MRIVDRTRLGALVLASVTVGLALAVRVPPTPAQEKDKEKEKVKVVMDDETKKATARALEWLAKQQNPDGSWNDGRYGHNTAITAYAMLAFMSQGHVPGQGHYGPEVAKGARYLIAAQHDNGYIVGAGGNMYCHAMSTLALAELWGMTGDDELKPVVKKAVELIINSQSKQEGGWRYNPEPFGSDISVTIMQVMALRAAKNSGLNVPDSTIERALAYVKRCYDPGSGGFCYQPNTRQPGFARTAAGVCVLELVGKYEGEEITRGVAYMKNHFDDHQYFFYGHYYASHAMHLFGGQDWADWYARLKRTLLPRQQADGSWSARDLDFASPGPVYQTSIAVIVLSTPAHYLPIFQR